MRHRKKSEKFSRSRAQRKALVKSLLQAVIINERIVTTTAKAKHMRGEVDKLITLAKKGTLAGRRLAYQALGNHHMVTKLFDAIAPRFPKTEGGYTRVLRVGTRKGDGACLSLLELTKVEKKKASKTVKAGAKAMPKAAKEQSPVKEKKAPKGIASRVKNIFKKDRDAI